MMLMPFFALYLNEQVGSTFLVGILMAVSPIAALIGSMYGGWLADKYGRKPMMIISISGNGLVLLGFLFFDNFISYLLLSALLGLFNSLFHPAASAMVIDVTPEEKRTEAFGLLRMGQNLGASIGPILGASIIVLSKNLIFIIASSSLLLYSLIILIFINETLPIKNNQEIEKEKEKNKNISLTFKIIFKDKFLIIYILAGISIFMGLSLAEGMLPIHFENELHSLSKTQNPYPYLIALNGLLVVLFQFIISKWATRRPIGKVMILGTFLFGLGLILLGWFPLLLRKIEADYWQILTILLIVYAIYTFGEMLIIPVQMTFAANIAPDDLRGSYMGAISLQWIIGGILGPISGGFLLDKSLGNLLFTILAIGSFISGFIYLSLDKNKK